MARPLKLHHRATVRAMGGTDLFTCGIRQVVLQPVRQIMLCKCRGAVGIRGRSDFLDMSAVIAFERSLTRRKAQLGTALLARI